MFIDKKNNFMKSESANSKTDKKFFLKKVYNEVKLIKPLVHVERLNKETKIYKGGYFDFFIIFKSFMCMFVYLPPVLNFFFSDDSQTVIKKELNLNGTISTQEIRFTYFSFFFKNGEVTFFGRSYFIGCVFFMVIEIYLYSIKQQFFNKHRSSLLKFINYFIIAHLVSFIFYFSFFVIFYELNKFFYNSKYYFKLGIFKYFSVDFFSLSV